MKGNELKEPAPTDSSQAKALPGGKKSLWKALAGGFHKFIWDDLREGMINLKDLPRLTRGVVRLGFLVLGLVLTGILFNAQLRSLSSLIPLINSSAVAPGRGVMLPSLLAPLTLVCVTFAWTYILCGAVHSHIAARLGVLFLFLLTASWQVVTLVMVAMTMSAGGQDLLLIAVELISVAAVPFLFLIFAKASLSPVLEFCVLLFFNALIFFIPQLRSALLLRQMGWPLGQLYLGLSIQDLFMIALPLLLQIGFDIADFARQASRWLANTASSLLPRWGAGAVLLLMLGWRLYAGAVEETARINRNGMDAELAAYAGALGVLVCVALSSLLVHRLGRKKQAGHADDEEAADIIGKKIFLLIIVFEVPFLVNHILGGLGRIILIPAFVQLVLETTNFILEHVTIWYQVVVVGALIIAARGARRGERVFPLYLGMFGALYLYSHVTGPKGILSELEWRSILPVTLWWLALLAAACIILLAGRRLSAGRAGELAFLVFITWLVGETDFIADPFSPIFGFAGVGFIVFGIVWDTLTRGSWANTGSRSFSRTSRIFLYLGYIILTATLVNWALTTHDLVTLNAMGGKAAMAGFERFGKPMLYVIYVLTLSEVFKKGEAAASG